MEGNRESGTVESEFLPRRLPAWLLAGVIFMPGVFVWFLLTPGFSLSLRLGGFTYFAVMMVPNILFIREHSANF